MLIPGAHDCDKELTKLILECLNEDFCFSGVNTIETFSKSTYEDQFRPKDKKSFIVGQFDEDDVRVDVGATTFSELQKDSVYYITHPYNRAINVNGKVTRVDVETTIKQARLVGEIFKRNHNGMRQLTLVTPIGPYDLNHSAERNRGKGLIEGPSLEMTIKDLARCGYNEIITTCPHSATTAEFARNNRILYRDIDPFQSIADLSPRLGPFLYKTPDNECLRDDYDDQVKRLTPFISYLKDNFGENMDDVYFVATDKGSEGLIMRLAYSCRGHKKGVLGILKDRSGPGVIDIKGLTSWSTADLEQIRDKICILADDRRMSGGTTELVARRLKDIYGAGKVVALIAHDLSYDQNILEQKSIDKFVFTETTPNSPIAKIQDPRIYRFNLKTTALLLATQIFDSYVSLRDTGKLEVR